MKHLLSFVLVLFTSMSFSQGEANIWYFGSNAGVDFSSGNPYALINGQLNTLEGCATLSNAAGQLLFYTDGLTIYNRNHQIMQNGTGLFGHPSSAQSATIVQKPGSTNLFYVFTIDYEAHANGFSYSIVDLNLDGGLGAVTPDKNILVLTPTLENLGITKHANGLDFWIVTHGVHNDSFYAYRLTSTGLNLTPVITNIGDVISSSGFFEAGTIKFAPSGTKAAFTSVMGLLQLFDFNKNSGVFSNPQTLLTEFGELYGTEFSPSEDVLYATNVSFGRIYQFDLLATNIPNSKINLYNGPKSPSALQIGPNGKIYIAVYGQNALGVINNPDIVGTGCNFVLSLTLVFKLYCFW
ncbi:MAG: hypothetical protein ACOVNU_02365, partial [Candidatus Kapaibacteriota bacterium]